MRKVSQENWAEKWILHVGRKASWKYWPLIWILFGLLFLVLFLLTKWTYCAIFAVSSMFVAYISFERRIFYRIIERQKKYIADIKRETDEKKIY